ncbi:MAG: right-handed parallel beta-helix repeat-containing protein [Bacteroidales bacterium]|nr:right-handed parallel beta-helix repeat-containing protein [Bacteroidales bacterium]
MKRLTLFIAAALCIAAFQPAQAQGVLGSLKNKVTGAAQNEARKAAQKGIENAKQNARDKAETEKWASKAGPGKTYYVSVSTGSARADGLSPENAMKDLQKAINAAEDNDVIYVAEGNYHGNLDRGYIECGKFGDSSHELGKFISIYGGWSTDFTERDVIKHQTLLQPSDHIFTAPLFNFNARRPYGYKGPLGEVVVDGLVFDFGENNRYCVANVDDARTGTPNKGVLTGRILADDEAPSVPLEGYLTGDEYALHMDVEGNVRVSNCIFVNCRDYGLNALMGKGHMEVCNNIFIACKYAACQVRGNVKDDDIDKVSLDFHHNTVLFTWTRNKTFSDMGQGFRFMNGIRTIDVHNNIFGCNSNCAVERVYYESNKQMESLKESNLYDNYFFANKRDLELAAMGKSTISVSADRIEEAEQIGPKFEGNMELPKGNEAFLNAIDDAYLKGYMSLTIVTSESYSPNSTANQINRMLGLNQQGTEIVRPNMFGNKYPWAKAKDLFGKVPGYGAQIPE